MTNEFEEVMQAFDGIDLHEDIFSADSDGMEAYKEFEDDIASESDEYFDVIDTEIEDGEEKSNGEYEGKVILECPICKCLFFEEDGAVISNEDSENEDGETVKYEGGECPCCHQDSGEFIKKFMAVPFVETTAEVTVTDDEGNVETYDVDGELEIDTTKDEDTEKDEDLEEAIKRFANKSIKEDIEEVTVKDGNAKVAMDGTTVQVKTEKQDTEELGVEEVGEDDFDDIDLENEGEEETEEEGETSEEDIDLNDVETESLERAFLNAKPYYESFRLKDISSNGKKIFVEGVARTRSGRRINESFSMSPRTIHKNKVTFVTEGLMRTPTIVRGRVDGNSLFVESLGRKRGNRK